MSTHIKAQDLKAGDQYRLTEGGDYTTVKSVEHNADMVTVELESGWKVPFAADDLVQARFINNVVSL
jgi:hypothetical protein